jgi:phosphate starvation-inducible PhoH-like protein
LSSTVEFTFEPDDGVRLARLCGSLNGNLRAIEERLGVEIINHGCHFRVTGSGQTAVAAESVLRTLFESTEAEEVTPEQTHLALQDSTVENLLREKPEQAAVLIKTRKITVKARGENQQQYVKNILSNDINFGVGPAGTGKTYLAVACAVNAFEKEEVSRIILARPAVEAGEKLGFLPGDLSQKVDPYLRPLYDALYEMLGFERVAKLIEKKVIEVAPLAFMRGRTLNNAFVILDEAQNSTPEQIKMFLTRIGFGSTAVITGDITQVDLPKGQTSGLRHVLDVLRDVEGISYNFFNAKDVVRHTLVQKIVTAYEAYERKND